MKDNTLFKNVLLALGYTRETGHNPRYYSLEEFSKIRTASHLRHVVSRINKDENTPDKDVLHGAYFLQISTDEEQIETLRPVVFVAQASKEAEAREIHRSLWNVGSIAFVIIILPDEVRVYTGFDYDKKREAQGLIEAIPFERLGLFVDISPLVIQALQKYSAEAIDNGSIWQTLRESRRFNYNNRVDKKLLRSLSELEDELLNELSGLEKTQILKYIHAIIGKYVYLRYLFDREILTEGWAKARGINLDKVLQRNATCDELLKLDRAIEERFGGNIFPLPEDFKKVFNDELVSFVAAVFKGDQAVGKQQVLFDIYNFSYIPVEMLSYIYEQFLQAQGKTKKEGAVYTPEALADYLINEIHTIKPLDYPLRRPMKVLDPCCGSGIFLVLTYRYLIELELFKQNVERLSPMDLRRIMEDCIYGVELNLEACYVTEFSLILVLLNYIEPPDLNKNKTFRFPRLHGKNIFQGNFFDPRKEFYPLSMKFDWIIGNPPWKTVDAAENPEDELVLDWINSNSETHPVGDGRAEEAFAWRALEFVKDDGCIGFVITAKRLFNDTSKNFRREFFYQTQVRRITNLSNFHYLLFPADVSPITIVYQKPAFGSAKQSIWHYSPFAANQIASRLKNKATRPIWAIAVNKSEIKQISYDKAEKGEALIWKIAFWGTYEDERAIERLANMYHQTLEQICEKRKWNLLYGLQLRDKGVAEQEASGDSVSSTKKKLKTIKALDSTLFETLDKDLCELDGNLLNKLDARYHIPKSALKVIPPEGRYYRARGGGAGERLIPAPHIVINPNYVIFSNEDFVIDDQTGISAPAEDVKLLSAISLYLGSSVGRYLTFFNSSQWGIDRTKIGPSDFRNLPIPYFSEEEIHELAKLQESVSERERKLFERKAWEKDGLFRSQSDVQEILYTQTDLRIEIDEKIESIMGLSESMRILIHDFLYIRLTLNKGKTSSSEERNVKAINFPTPQELKAYALRLRDQLDNYAEQEQLKHLVSIVYSDDLTVCQVTPVKTLDSLDILVTESVSEWKDLFAQINEALQEQFSQWAYFQRELRVFDNNYEIVSLCKPSRLIHWMESKAIADANDIIAESLANNNRYFEPISSKNEYDSNYSDTSKLN